MPDDPQEIAARGIDQIGGRRKCFIGDALELLPIAGGLAEALPDLMRNRGAETDLSLFSGAKRTLCAQSEYFAF